MLDVTLAGLVALASIQAPAVQEEAPRALAQVRFEAYLPQPKAALELSITGDGGLRLEELVDAYEAATHVTFVVDQEVESLLQHASAGISSLPDLEPHEVPTFLQCLLRAQDFVLSPISPPEIGLIQVISLRTNARNTVRQTALTVDAADLDTMRRNPAFLMTTVITIEHTDPRQLSNAMRTMIVDANTQQLLPAGSSNKMVLTAFGDQLAELVVQLRSVDEASAAGPEQPQLLVRRLQHANAAEVEAMLAALFQDPARPAQEGVPRPSLRTSHDERTNTLLVHGVARDLESIEELLRRLDVEVE